MEEYAKHLADKKGYSVVVYEDYGDIGMLITMQCNNIMVHCGVYQGINGFCLTRLRKPGRHPHALYSEIFIANHSIFDGERFTFLHQNCYNFSGSNICCFVAMAYIIFFAYFGVSYAYL